MADNYCESSTYINLESNQISKAKEIVSRITESIEEESGYLDVTVVIEEKGVWLYSQENFNPEHAEKIIKALVEELKLTDIIICSWSYTCSKPRIDEFDGGAFAVAKEQDTIWIYSAAEEAKHQMEEILNFCP